MLLNARRVFDEDGSASAIFLAIEDVTRRREANREKDDLLQAKEILLQEMQHRVAAISDKQNSAHHHYHSAAGLARQMSALGH